MLKPTPRKTSSSLQQTRQMNEFYKGFLFSGCALNTVHVTQTHRVSSTTGILTGLCNEVIISPYITSELSVSPNRVYLHITERPESNLRKSDTTHFPSRLAVHIADLICCSLCWGGIAATGSHEPFGRNPAFTVDVHTVNNGTCWLTRGDWQGGASSD